MYEIVDEKIEWIIIQYKATRTLFSLLVNLRNPFSKIHQMAFELTQSIPGMEALNLLAGSFIISKKLIIE
jgi:hypothetical protein